MFNHYAGPGKALDKLPPDADIDDILVYQVEDGQLIDRWYLAPFDPIESPFNAAVDVQGIPGIWHALGLDLYTRYYEDGTYHIGGFLDTLDDEPLVMGEYWFDEGQLVIKELKVVDAYNCGPEPAIYTTDLLDNGNLEMTMVVDGCANRVYAMEREYAPVP